MSIATCLRCGCTGRNVLMLPSFRPEIPARSALQHLHVYARAVTQCALISATFDSRRTCMALKPVAATAPRVPKFAMPAPFRQWRYRATDTSERISMETHSQPRSSKDLHCAMAYIVAYANDCATRPHFVLQGFTTRPHMQSMPQLAHRRVAHNKRPNQLSV